MCLLTANNWLLLNSLHWLLTVLTVFVSNTNLLHFRQINLIEKIWAGLDMSWTEVLIFLSELRVEMEWRSENWWEISWSEINLSVQQREGRDLSCNYQNILTSSQSRVMSESRHSQYQISHKLPPDNMSGLPGLDTMGNNTQMRNIKIPRDGC